MFANITYRINPDYTWWINKNLSPRLDKNQFIRDVCESSIVELIGSNNFVDLQPSSFSKANVTLCDIVRKNIRKNLGTKTDSVFIIFNTGITEVDPPDNVQKALDEKKVKEIRHATEKITLASRKK